MASVRIRQSYWGPYTELQRQKRECEHSDLSCHGFKSAFGLQRHLTAVARYSTNPELDGYESGVLKMVRKRCCVVQKLIYP